MLFVCRCHPAPSLHAARQPATVAQQLSCSSAQRLPGLPFSILRYCCTCQWRSALPMFVGGFCSSGLFPVAHIRVGGGSGDHHWQVLASKTPLPSTRAVRQKLQLLIRPTGTQRQEEQPSGRGGATTATFSAAFFALPVVAPRVPQPAKATPGRPVPLFRLQRLTPQQAARALAPNAQPHPGQAPALPRCGRCVTLRASCILL